MVTEVCPLPPPPAMRSRTLMKKGKLIGFPEFRGIVLLTSLTSLRELNYMYLFVIIVKLPFSANVIHIHLIKIIFLV